jgi:hypothetical protein
VLGDSLLAAWLHFGALIYCTVMFLAAEGMPFATTYNLPAPVSTLAGTSNIVDTRAVPVATPMLLWLCVLQ